MKKEETLCDVWMFQKGCSYRISVSVPFSTYKGTECIDKGCKLFLIRFFIVIEKVPAIFQMEDLNKSFLISVLLAVEEKDEDLNLEQLS